MSEKPYIATELLNFTGCPPPNPLIPKTFHPSKPALKAQNIPFQENLSRVLPEFPGTEEEHFLNEPIDRESFPDPYPPHTSLRSLFHENSLVYIRNPNQFESNFLKTFNENTVNIRKLPLQNYEFPIEELDPFYKGEDSLIFESRFESGNLSLVSKFSENEYNLLLQNDINSNGYIQWFFFNVKNTKQQQTVKFNILNFSKEDSLFNKGMKISVYSEKRFTTKLKGWKKSGFNIFYYPNGIIRNRKKKSQYYSLTFTYTFKYSQDSVYFAQSIPYTYTKLMKYLDFLEQDPIRSKVLTRKTLCKTVSGNPCDYLTITNQGTIEENNLKKGVIISARVHPGEVVGSWMMHGVLDFLTSTEPEADLIRDLFVVRVVPMLNPDGVINGNYRCSLVGADLNRRWLQTNCKLHPVIFSLQRLVKSVKNKIELICDLHGHSRKKNVFIYACDIPEDLEACRFFPYALSRVSPVFKYEYCQFGVQTSKESTMRVSLFKELKVLNTFSMEASFSGCNFGSFKGFHFTTEMLLGVGKDLCRTFLMLDNSEVVRAYTGEVLTRTSLVADFWENQKRCSFETEESGSDSDPSDDNLEIEVLGKFVPLTRKRTRRKKTLPPATPTVKKTPNFSEEPKILPHNKSICHKLPPVINSTRNCRQISVSTESLYNRISRRRIAAISPEKRVLISTEFVEEADEIPGLLSTEVIAEKKLEHKFKSYKFHFKPIREIMTPGPIKTPTRNFKFL